METIKEVTTSPTLQTPTLQTPTEAIYEDFSDFISSYKLNEKNISFSKCSIYSIIRQIANNEEKYNLNNVEIYGKEILNIGTKSIISLDFHYDEPITIYMIKNIGLMKIMLSVSPSSGEVNLTKKIVCQIAFNVGSLVYKEPIQNKGVEYYNFLYEKMMFNPHIIKFSDIKLN